VVNTIDVSGRQRLHALIHSGPQPQATQGSVHLPWSVATVRPAGGVLVARVVVCIRRVVEPVLLQAIPNGPERDSE